MWTHMVQGSYLLTMLVVSAGVIHKKKRVLQVPVVWLLPLATVLEILSLKDIGSLLPQYIYTTLQNLLYLYTLKYWQIRFPYRLYTLLIVLLMLIAYCSSLSSIYLTIFIYCESLMWFCFYGLIMWRKAAQQNNTIYLWSACFILYDSAFNLLIILLKHARFFQEFQAEIWLYCIGLQTCILLLFYIFLHKALKQKKTCYEI